MNEHVETYLLEEWLLAPETVGNDVAAQIERHTKECALCRENLVSLRKLYELTESNLQPPPSEQDRMAAARLVPRRPRLLQSGQMTLADRFEQILTPQKNTFVSRVIRMVLNHPMRSSAVGALALGGLVLFSLTTRRPFDGNPAFARVKNEQLTVFNKEAEILWKRSALGINDGSNDIPIDTRDGMKTLLRLADVDGDGTKEVLMFGCSGILQYATDSLYCFESTGGLRWTAGVGTLIPPSIQDKRSTSTAIIGDFTVMRTRPASKPHIFVIAAQGYTSWAKLSEFDAKTGTELHTFYNRGHVTRSTHADVDRNGKEELLLGGVNDGFNRGCLIIFDPDSVGGMSPYPEATGEGQPGTEIHYVLFPVTRLQRSIGRNLYSYTKEIITPSEHSSLMLRVGESILTATTDIAPSLFYTLGPDLRAQQVTADDNFQTLYERLLREGKIAKTPMAEYLQTLRDSLLYWNGSAFERSPRSAQIPASVSPSLLP